MPKPKQVKLQIGENQSREEAKQHRPKKTLLRQRIKGRRSSCPSMMQKVDFGARSYLNLPKTRYLLVYFIDIKTLGDEGTSNSRCNGFSALHARNSTLE